MRARSSARRFAIRLNCASGGSSERRGHGRPRRSSGRLARLAGVEPMDVSWRLATTRTFDNSIGQLELDGRGAPP